MEITEACLNALRAKAEEQRAHHIAMINQAVGAIAMIDLMLGTLATPEREKTAAVSQ